MESYKPFKSIDLYNLRSVNISYKFFADDLGVLFGQLFTLGIFSIELIVFSSVLKIVF